MDRSVLEADPHAVIEGMAIGARAIEQPKASFTSATSTPWRSPAWASPSARPRSWGFWAKISLVRDSISTSRSCGAPGVRLGRGDGPDRLDRRATGVSPAEAALSGPAGPLGKAHGDQQRRDLGQCPFHHQARRGLVLEPGNGHEQGDEDLLARRQDQNTGLVEVPMGIRLRDIIFGIGGGIPGGREFKAIQIGGPSGGCIPKDLLDLPVDYESLIQAGAMMGSGGMIVMDEDTCMVDIALYFSALRKRNPAGNALPADRHAPDGRYPGPHHRRRGQPRRHQEAGNTRPDG